MNHRPRTVLLIAHTGRQEAVEVACAVSKRLMDSDMSVRLLADEAADLGIANATVVPADADAARDCEVVW